jgi:hypothetical protein
MQFGLAIVVKIKFAKTVGMVFPIKPTILLLAGKFRIILLLLRVKLIKI